MDNDLPCDMCAMCYGCKIEHTHVLYEVRDCECPPKDGDSEKEGEMEGLGVDEVGEEEDGTVEAPDEDEDNGKNVDENDGDDEDEEPQPQPLVLPAATLAQVPREPSPGNPFSENQSTSPNRGPPGPPGPPGPSGPPDNDPEDPDGDDDDSSSDSTDSGHRVQSQLATAISLIARTLERTAAPPTAPTAPNQPSGNERHNVREPDQFDGSDPNKRRSFFTQLVLVFKARPRTFDSDERKVTYALSYLKGTALQWFEPYLLEGYSEEPPLFLYSYEAFQDELRINFGPYDATGAAEHDLENLRMTEGQRIAKYITQFNRLATQVRWGTAALRYQFYKGLPDRLKDRISEVGKPNTLSELRELVQSLDH